jgi:hypothetical protein
MLAPPAAGRAAPSMGKRSRKRASELGTRAERDAARRERRAEPAVSGRPAPSPRRRSGRPSSDERPRPPWGSFPLSELVVLVGIVLIVWGVLSEGDARNERLVAGLVIAALGGLELALREHLAGFRSHSTLLAGVVAFVVVAVLALGPGPNTLGVLLIIGALVFAASFYALRQLFIRRSGGLSFR